MNILEHLHPELDLYPDHFYSTQGEPMQPPASDDDLRDLLAALPETPQEYLNLLAQHDGFAVMQRPEGTQLPFIMSFLCAGDALARPTQWHPWTAEQLPEAFILATNGGDDVYFSSLDPRRPGIYQCEPASIAWENARYMGKNLQELLCDGIGWADEEDRQGTDT